MLLLNSNTKMPKNHSITVRLTKEQKEKILARMKYEGQTNLSEFTIDKLIYQKPKRNEDTIYKIHDMLTGIYSRMTDSYSKKKPKYSPY